MTLRFVWGDLLRGIFRTHTCDGWEWRKQHWKVEDAKLLIQLQQRPQLILQGALELEPQNCSSWGKGRSVSLHEVIIRCRLTPERTVILGKAASFYQEQVLQRTQLWLSSQLLWQLGEWASLPEGRSRWHSTASTITILYLVVSEEGVCYDQCIFLAKLY